MINEEQLRVRDEIVSKYAKDLEKLQKYIPYLEKKGESVSQDFYKGEGNNFKSVPFPVYDSALLSFVKEAGTTQFMNRNYPYVYRRYHINGVEDEKKLIKTAGFKDIDIFGGILSRYVMEGRKRGMVWTEGLQHRIYLDIILSLNKLFYEYYEPEKRLH